MYTSVLLENTPLIKIPLKSHPGLRWCIFHIFTSEDINDFTEIFGNKSSENHRKPHLNLFSCSTLYLLCEISSWTLEEIFLIYICSCIILFIQKEVISFEKIGNTSCVSIKLWKQIQKEGEIYVVRTWHWQVWHLLLQEFSSSLI